MNMLKNGEINNMTNSTIDVLKKLIDNPIVLRQTKSRANRLSAYVSTPLMLGLLNSQDILETMQMVSVNSTISSYSGKLMHIHSSFLQQLVWAGTASRQQPFYTDDWWSCYNSMDGIGRPAVDQQDSDNSYDEDDEPEHPNTYIDDEDRLYDADTGELLMEEVSLHPDEYEERFGDDTGRNLIAQEPDEYITLHEILDQRPNSANFGLRSGSAAYTSAMMNEYQLNDAGTPRFIGHDFGPLKDYLSAIKSKDKDGQKKNQLLMGPDLDIKLLQYNYGSYSQIDCIQFKFKHLETKSIQPDLYFVQMLNNISKLVQACGLAAAEKDETKRDVRLVRAWNMLNQRVHDMSKGQTSLNNWLITERVMIAMFEPDGTTLSVYFIDPKLLKDDPKALLVDGILYSMPDHAMIGGTLDSSPDFYNGAADHHYIAQTKKTKYPIPLFMKSWDARVAMLAPREDPSHRSYRFVPDAPNYDHNQYRYIGSLVTGRLYTNSNIDNKDASINELLYQAMMPQSLTLYRVDDSTDAGHQRFKRPEDRQIAQPLNFTLASAQQMSRDMISSLIDYQSTVRQMGLPFSNNYWPMFNQEIAEHLTDASYRIDVVESNPQKLFDYSDELLDKTLVAVKTNINLTVCRMLELSPGGLLNVDGATAFDTLTCYLTNSIAPSRFNPDQVSLNIVQRENRASYLTAHLMSQNLYDNPQPLIALMKQLDSREDISYNDFSQRQFLGINSVLELEELRIPEVLNPKSQNDTYPLVRLLDQRDRTTQMVKSL